jgi:homoserine kinase type II
MAVYTPCSAEDIATFLTQYDVGKLIMAKGIAEGVQNSNYLIETDRNRFILTLYESRTDVDDLPYFHQLTAHLAEKGLPVPAAIPNFSSAVVNELCGRPASLIQFLTGVSVSEPTLAHCEAVGAVMAKLQMSGADFPQARRNSLSISNWQSTTDYLNSKLDEIEPGLQKLVEAAVADCAQHWPTDLPFGAIHADLFPDNVLFAGNRVTGLIDFYFACSDFYAYDFAVLLNSWAFSSDGTHYYADRAEALLKGYEAVRRFTPDERKSMNLLCKGASLRFLLTRAYDWINTPPTALVTRKDPIAYARRLRWFQANTAAL